MHSLKEIHKIADTELCDEDTIKDLESENMSGRELWRSGFTVGYQMGQANVEKYDDIF